MSLAQYQRKFRALYVNTTRGRRSPHKVCMLLAMPDLARGGALKANRIVYGPQLLERYNRYFDAVRADEDHPNAFFPFFHLGGDLRAIEPGGDRPRSFWQLQPLPGHAAELARMSTARSHRDITEVIECASAKRSTFASAALHDARRASSWPVCSKVAAGCTRKRFRSPARRWPISTRRD